VAYYNYASYSDCICWDVGYLSSSAGYTCSRLASDGASIGTITSAAQSSFCPSGCTMRLN
jgi:hypothetical protein